MELRELGKSGIKVAPLGFGGNVFGWTVDEVRSFELLDCFVDLGFNLIDTADVYSAWVPGHKGGESELIIGKWLKKTGKRSKVVLATKVGHELMPRSEGLRKDYILRAVEDSLRRLGTDTIDLYQAHRDDPNTPFSETHEAFELLRKQGKVRAIGASNFSAERLKESLDYCKQRAITRYEVLQPLYNLYDRHEFETELQPLCEEHGLSVINYYSLAAGFLTGKYRESGDLAGSIRGRGAVKRYFNEKGFRILEVLDQVSKRFSASPAQVSLAWLLTKKTIAAPLASATTSEQLRELAGAVDLRLDEESIAALDHAHG